MIYETCMRLSGAPVVSPENRRIVPLEQCGEQRFAVQNSSQSASSLASWDVTEAAAHNVAEAAAAEVTAGRKVAAGSFAIGVTATGTAATESPTTSTKSARSVLRFTGDLHNRPQRQDSISAELDKLRQLSPCSVRSPYAVSEAARLSVIPTMWPVTTLPNCSHNSLTGMGSLFSFLSSVRAALTRILCSSVNPRLASSVRTLARVYLRACGLLPRLTPLDIINARPFTFS